MFIIIAQPMNYFISCYFNKQFENYDFFIYHNYLFIINQ